jgi:type II secretory pathway component GspD/PulD (secretin)
MNRILASLAGLWLAALLIPSSPAQTKLDRRTTIDVTAAAPRDVYGSLARTLGCELILTPEIRQNVTLHLENVTIRTALTALSESVGGQWSMEGNTLRVVPAGSARPGGITGGVPGGVKGGVTGGVPGGVSGGVVGGVPGGGSGNVDFKQRLERKTPDNFHFEDRPLRSVMEALGKVADLEVQIEEPAATQRVTLDLSNRTIMAALKTIREQTGMEKAIVLVATIPGSEQRMHLKMGSPKKNE